MALLRRPGEPAHGFSLILLDVYALSVASAQRILGHRIALRGVLAEVFQCPNQRPLLPLYLGGLRDTHSGWTTDQPGQERTQDEQHEEGCDGQQDEVVACQRE